MGLKRQFPPVQEHDSAVPRLGKQSLQAEAADQTRSAEEQCGLAVHDAPICRQVSVSRSQVVCSAQKTACRVGRPEERQQKGYMATPSEACSPAPEALPCPRECSTKAKRRSRTSLREYWHAGRAGSGAVAHLLNPGLHRRLRPQS